MSLYVVRGNIYLHLRLHPSNATASSPAAVEPLEPIAERIVAHLSSRTTPLDHRRRPELHIGAPASRSFHVGDTIALTAEGDTFAHIHGSSSNCRAVIYGGRKGHSNEVEFFAVGEGESELSLHVAHKETLAPGTERVRVTVGTRA